MTLSAPVAVPAGGARLSFSLWYDTVATDVGVLEASRDGGATWRAVPLSLRAGKDRWRTDGTFSGFEGRQWLDASARLPGGTTTLRWSYTTHASYQGRGVYVNGVRVTGPGGRVLFDERRPVDAAGFEPDGWVRSRA